MARTPSAVRCLTTGENARADVVICDVLVRGPLLHSPAHRQPFELLLVRGCRTNLGELPTKETFRSGNNVSLRISLSAQQLTNPSFVVSNTYILVQVKYLTWFDFHRTEVRRSTDPDFKESAVFNVCSPRLPWSPRTQIQPPICFGDRCSWYRMGN